VSGGNDLAPGLCVSDRPSTVVGEGPVKIIAAILEQTVIEKMLTHLDRQARAPPRSPARGQALQAA
jgi:hypothetical protein